jgi:PKD repeat protein
VTISGGSIFILEDLIGVSLGPLMKKTLLLILSISAVLSCKDDSPAPVNNQNQQNNQTPAPKACFQGATSGTQGIEVSFDGSCSTDAAIYHWYFGDGQETTATTAGASHTYALPGKYSVRLRVEKSGVKDSVSHDVNIVLSSNQSSCLPTYLYSPELWPYYNLDSVTIDYRPDKKIDVIHQRAKGITNRNYYNNLVFSYNVDGTISKVDMVSAFGNEGTFAFTYDSKKLPGNLVFTASPGDTTYIAAFIHNDNNQLTGIDVTSGSFGHNYTFRLTNKIRYEYDAYGNTKKIFHTYNNKPEELEWLNKSFDNSLVYYYSSPELKQYLDYVCFRGVYKNNVSSGIIYSEIDPDLNSMTTYPDSFPFTGKSTVDPQLNLIIKYEAALDVDSYAYTCF